jgi:predicted acetyltransferase
MTIEVRPVRDEELGRYIDAMSTGFLERPDVDKVVEVVRELWDLERTLGAFDGDRVCGTFRSWPTELTVAGGALLPAAAVSAVTVLPTHRRRGVLRSMLAAEHRAIRNRGEAVGLLYASEYPIYGRFGYGLGTLQATWTLDTLAGAFQGDSPGRVELAPPTDGSRDEICAVFERHRAGQPGEIRRRPWSWDFELGLREEPWGQTWKGFLALHRDGKGVVDGYARYRAEENWVQRQPRNALKLDELHALTGDAYHDLWRFLAEIDWVATIKAERRRSTERLPWLLTNGRAASVSDVGDGLWVRLFDVPRALETRSYERDGRLVVVIVDSEATGGRSRFALDVEGGRARCRVTRRSPDLTIDVAALGAAYLGGTRLRDAVLGSGADEHRADALAEADALLRSPEEPWCSTFF